MQSVEHSDFGQLLCLLFPPLLIQVTVGIEPGFAGESLHLNNWPTWCQIIQNINVFGQIVNMIKWSAELSLCLYLRISMTYTVLSGTLNS